jgi:hypothetical protein
MIGIFTAALALINRKAVRVQQIRRIGAGARRIKRRMLKKPQTFGRRTGNNIGDALLHKSNGIGIGDGLVAEYQFGHLAHKPVISLKAPFIKTKLNVE